MIIRNQGDRKTTCWTDRSFVVKTEVFVSKVQTTRGEMNLKYNIQVLYTSLSN